MFWTVSGAFVRGGDNRARADVYEAGNVFAKWPVGVLERQYYGDDINPAKSTGTPVYPAGVPVPPPTGMTQAQWDEASARSLWLCKHAS